MDLRAVFLPFFAVAFHMCHGYISGNSVVKDAAYKELHNKVVKNLHGRNRSKILLGRYALGSRWPRYNHSYGLPLLGLMPKGMRKAET